MGEIILMPRKRSAARSEPLAQASAQILFFTGVRYQRMVEPEESDGRQPPAVGGKRRRKRG